MARWTPEIRRSCGMLGPADRAFRRISYQIGALAEPKLSARSCPPAASRDISYADRLYQLPGGVIVDRHRLGAAQGNVGPRRPRRHPGGAMAAQNRAASHDAGARRSPSSFVFFLPQAPDLIVKRSPSNTAPSKHMRTQQAAGCTLRPMQSECQALAVSTGLVNGELLSAPGDYGDPPLKVHAGRRRRQCNGASRSCCFGTARRAGLGARDRSRPLDQGRRRLALARRRGWTAPDHPPASRPPADDCCLRHGSARAGS